MAHAPVASMLARIRAPVTRGRFHLPVPPIRSFSYPKEGVFQPNSPPREIPGFGPAPPLGQSQVQPSFASQPQQPNQPPQEPASKSGRWFRFMPRWWNILIGIYVGGTAVFQVHQRFAFLSPIEPDSEEDKEELDELFAELDEYSIVQQLQSEKKYVDGKGYVPVWEEYTAYSGFSDDRKPQRLTTGPLAGSAGVAAQRVYWNEDLKQCFLFINFGPAVCGWPEVVHGGAVTTICDETLGRVAIRTSEAKTAITAHLEVKFEDKVVPGLWYLLVAGIDGARESECTDRKKYVRGALVCVNEATPQKDGESLTDVHVHCQANGESPSRCWRQTFLTCGKVYS